MQRDRGKGPAGRAASCRDGGVNAFGWAGRLVGRPGARRRPWHLAAAGRPCLWPASLFQEERLRTWEQKARGELAPLSPEEGGARMESPQLRRKAGSESKLSPHLVFELKKKNNSIPTARRDPACSGGACMVVLKSGASWDHPGSLSKSSHPGPAQRRGAARGSCSLGGGGVGWGGDR